MHLEHSEKGGEYDYSGPSIRDDFYQIATEESSLAKLQEKRVVDKTSSNPELDLREAEQSYRRAASSYRALGERFESSASECVKGLNRVIRMRQEFELKKRSSSRSDVTHE